MGYYDELKVALDTAKNEHDISDYIKQNIILIERLKHYWNGSRAKAEFRIGTEYRADFVVLSACSGFWECLLIEMQSPRDHIFTEKREASRGLREAERQIRDWKLNISENGQAFRKQLAKLATGLPAYCSNSERHQRADTELLDPNTVIQYRYMVLIGRREYLTKESNRHRSAMDIEIITFDRLLDDAKRLDEAETWS